MVGRLFRTAVTGGANQRFFDERSHRYATGSQTSYAMPLYLDLVEEQHRSAVVRNLLDSIIDGGKALTAGDRADASPKEACPSATRPASEYCAAPRRALLSKWAQEVTTSSRTRIRLLNDVT
ncbi:MAG: hypothetical protein GEV06_24695 [Luteitalea sp.]|nr:hypothetical protein [Luteitalea sp.]